MTVRLNSKLIDAAPNVVRLPSAAPRQVQQNHNRWSREARRILRAEAPWPGTYLHPHTREREAKDAAIGKLCRSPELAALLCLMQALPPKTLDAAQAASGMMTERHPECESAAIAAALIAQAASLRKGMEALARLSREGQ